LEFRRVLFRSREPVFQGLDGPAPGVASDAPENERRGERLAGSAGVAGVLRPAGRLQPEAGDGAFSRVERAAEAPDVAGKSEADGIAVAREGRPGVAEGRPPLQAVATQRQIAPQSGAERRLRRPEADERIFGR